MSADERLHLHERPARGFCLPDAVLTISSDIPESMTIDQYRRSRPKSISAAGRLRSKLSFAR